MSQNDKHSIVAQGAHWTMYGRGKRYVIDVHIGIVARFESIRGRPYMGVITFFSPGDPKAVRRARQIHLLQSRNRFLHRECNLELH